MKKQLLLAFAFVAMALGINAQESKTWNINDFDAAIYTETTEINGLTLFAGTTVDGGEVKWEVEAQTKDFTFGDITCSSRLKSGGSSQFDGDGNLIGRALKFEVSTKGTIRFAAVSSSSSGTDRYVEFVIDGKTAHSYNVPSGTGSMTLQSFNYEGNAGTMQVLITGSGGINFYYLDWTDLSDGTEPGEPGTGDEETIEWNFNTEEYLVGGKEDKENLDEGTYTGLNGMTIIAANEKSKFELSKSIAEGSPSTIATKGAFNTGGSGNGFELEVKEGDEIAIAMGGTGRIDPEKLRGLDVYENDEKVEELRLVGGDVAQYVRDFTYTVKADGTIKFLSEQAVAIYNVILTKIDGEEPGEPGEPGTSIDNTTSEKAIIATEYYTINGIRLNAPVQGINIVKNVMEDGSVEVSKTYIK